MIGIIDYGSGNLAAICNIYNRAGIPYVLASKPEQLDGCSKALLPGVGAFDQAMNELNSSGIRRALDRWALEEKKPLLGICVGMQLLACRSEEGVLPGLSWIDGVVRKLDRSKSAYPIRLPHMGWNSIETARPDRLFENVDLENGFYFLHSYYFDCASPTDALAKTTYGYDFTCVVNRGNIYGVQFHPEKSHEAGVQVLKNFATMPV